MIRIVGFVLAASLALAAFKAAIAVLMASYLVLLIVAFIVRPTEVFGLFGFFLVCFLLSEHTAATIGTICVIILACAIAKRNG